MRWLWTHLRDGDVEEQRDPLEVLHRVCRAASGMCSLATRCSTALARLGGCVEGYSVALESRYAAACFQGCHDKAVMKSQAAYRVLAPPSLACRVPVWQLQQQCLERWLVRDARRHDHPGARTVAPWTRTFHRRSTASSLAPPRRKDDAVVEDDGWIIVDNDGGISVEIHGLLDDLR